MGILNSLNREQKEATGLLQIGTFLEYFDVMLYVHMAVILNELFFPKTDPHTASLLAAFAFCSTFVFRPIGALIFGWIGDHVGRRSTIILTTSLMSVSCILMACLPTYAQIGITATWIMTLCRIAQGMSSMGEIVGAQIYLTESIRRPTSYPMVAYISVASDMGGMVALGISYLVTSFLFNWRLAFWIGAIIAFVGAVARTRLRETPDFLSLEARANERSYH
ncbi:MAG: MHS family MFS transporter [Alphaproteobacteria bacterium]|nr:MHS family MFS transporter [Alphaproteobacteria bacterium]